MPAVSWFRLALLVVVAWPFLMAGAAMAGVPAVTALVALLPLLAAVSYAIVTLDPVLALQLAKDSRVQQSWQTVRTVIVVELSLGAYFTFVPVHTKPFLVVQLVLVLVILGLSQAGGAFLHIVPWVAALMFLLITVSFFRESPKAEPLVQRGARVPVRVAGGEPAPSSPVPARVATPVAEDDHRGASSELSSPSPRPALPPDTWWVQPGAPAVLEEGSIVSAEFQSLDGEGFVTLRISAGGATVTRAVVGGEALTIHGKGRTIRLRVADVDWRGQRLLLRAVR